MNIPIISKWLKSRENKKVVAAFLKLEMRKARIIDYKRKYNIKDPK